MFVLSPVLKQWIVVTAVNLNSLATGLAINWPSPMLVKLTDKDSTVLNKPITLDEVTWVVSVAQIVQVPCAFLVPIFVNRMGRRNTLLLSFMPKMAGCLLVIFAKEVWHLILARILEGISMCSACIAVSTYTAEIADKTLRGTLGSLTQIFISLGVVAMMTLGPFLSYFTMNVAYLALVVVCLITVLPLPETPYFMYSKGKHKESEDLLNTIRRCDEETREELCMYEELMGAKQSSFCQMLRKSSFKAFGITCFIGVFSQLSGFNVLSLYFQTVMESTKTVSSEMSSVIFGLVQLFSCIVPLFLTDRIGRKPILCFTMLLIGLGMAALGGFFWWKETGHTISSYLNYLPLAAAIIINFGYSAGFGSIVFVLIPELFEGPSRGLGAATVISAMSATVFLLLKCYGEMIAGLGTAGTYWLFSGCCVVFSLFIAVAVPETKGKLFKDIQTDLGKGQ